VSYILEALRKMERQRRHESEPESWVEDVSAESDEERIRGKSPGLMIIAVSIFFGICGVVTGILLYQGNDVPRPSEKVAAQTKPLPQSTAPSSVGQDDRNGGRTTPIPLPRQGEPKKEKGSLPPPRGVTLSAIKASQPKPSPLFGKEAAKDPALPPILSDDVAAEKPPAVKEVIPKPVPNEKEDVMEGAVVLKSNAPLPPKISEEPLSDRAIDLTRKYRLSSTGEVHDRKYATIERNDYFIGDNFMGMVISDIQRDRVYLRKDGSSQRYVIIFRYFKE